MMNKHWSVNRIPDIIAIHGVPRSGTSWLGQIFNSHPTTAFRYQPLFSYAFKDRININSSKEELYLFFNELLKTEDEFILQKEQIARKNYPEFAKKHTITHLIMKHVRYHHLIEHLLKNCTNLKIIGVIRNPLSVMNSWLRAPKEFKEEWDPLEEWRFAPKKNLGRKEEFFGFEKWKEVAYMFLSCRQKYPESFYLLEYKKLHNNTLEETNKLFQFCNLTIENQTIKFINESKTINSSDLYSVYRKNHSDDKWKKQLSPTIIKEILSDLKDSALERFLYYENEQGKYV